MAFRLKTTIRRISYWKMIYVAGYFCVLITILNTLALPWWVSAVVLLVSIVVIGLSEKNVDQPLHIHEPDPLNEATHWQLLYANKTSKQDVKDSKKALWEANLIAKHNLGHCVQLVFATVHPIKAKKTVVIWQDQVDEDVWRQLRVITLW